MYKVCIDINIYIYVYIHMCVCVCMCLCIYICIYIYICACVYIYIHTYACVCIYIYICVCLRVIMYANYLEMYQWIYIYTHNSVSSFLLNNATFRHIHVYTYVHGMWSTLKGFTWGWPSLFQNHPLLKLLSEFVIIFSTGEMAKVSCYFIICIHMSCF